MDFSIAAKGGFSYRKKPLECLLPFYTNSETAISVLIVDGMLDVV